MDLHTEGNAVPPLAGTELGDLLDDLHGFDEGIDQIVSGLRNIALRRLTDDRIQLLLATLCGSPDATDLVGAIALLKERLTDPDTSPALRALPLDVQKETVRHGELAAYALRDPELRDSTAAACAALDTH